MPLHPIPIIVGTTLAVIGSGIAFKKFVYDPHLAPYIEAFLASHSISSPSHHREPVAVSLDPIPINGQSTARQDRARELRRRHKGQQDDYDLQEPLLRRSDSELFIDMRRGSAADFQPPSVGGIPMPHRGSITRQQLIDLDRPSSPQDAEVREIIFKQAPTPLRPSGIPSPRNYRQASLPKSQSQTPQPVQNQNHFVPLAPVPLHLSSPHTPSVQLGNIVPASTAFSFLSLSQTSSPEAPNAMLQSFTFDSIGEGPIFGRSTSPGGQNENIEGVDEQWTDVPRVQSRMTREEDVMSLPETFASGYEEFETHLSGIAQSRSLPRSPVNSTVQPEQRSVLGVSHIDERDGAGFTENDSRRHGGAEPERAEQAPVRRPMSVVSLSESEGSDGESDWIGVRSVVDL